MKARLTKLLVDLSETFWLVPAMMVVLGVLLALLCVQIDRDGMVPQWLIDSPYLYSGGGTGARTMLGAVASSTIGVAGTVFSITIAALTLAAGQMGPRLLRNFTHDRGSQVTLGTFLGTFAYALMVLRSVRTHDEGEFVPHLSLTLAVLLALLSVALLVYFVEHMAGRINVDTVIGLVSDDVGEAIERLTLPAGDDDETDRSASLGGWHGASRIVESRRGYLQALDSDGLAAWAAEHRTRIRLLVRPGGHVFPGSVVALVDPAIDGAAQAIHEATALGSTRMSTGDLEFSIRQLVEIAVRALSPGINDPNTAMSVIDHLGDALCSLATRRLPGGSFSRDDRLVLEVPVVDYDGLTDAMFHLIRQNADGSAAVLIRMLEVLTAVAAVDRDPARGGTLARHAGLVLSDGTRDVANQADRADLVARHAAFVSARSAPGPLESVP